jgi:hypothetical protein
VVIQVAILDKVEQVLTTQVPQVVVLGEMRTAKLVVQDLYRALAVPVLNMGAVAVLLESIAGPLVHLLHTEMVEMVKEDPRLTEQMVDLAL